MKKASPTTTTAPTGQIAPFGLRMLPELRGRIEEAARESGRSMNAEVVSRLEASFGDGVDELAELERFRREVLLRTQTEHARTNAGAFAEAFILLYRAVQDGTWVKRQPDIEKMVAMAQRQLDSIKDGDFARLTAEYEAAKAQHEALVARRRIAIPLADAAPEGQPENS